MKRDYTKILLRSSLITIVGVLVIDYFSHLLFSNPMETGPYFLAKLALYLIFSFLFLSLINLGRHKFIKVALAGMIVALIWGAYYNVLPILFDYYPFGIPLAGLTFLRMGTLGTGLAFGIVHTLAFVGGYYFSGLMFKNNHKNI